MDFRYVFIKNERNDYLFKIRNVSLFVINKCKIFFNCDREVFVDEVMIFFKGRLVIKVRMFDKFVKFGISFLFFVMRKADIVRMLLFMLVKMIE